MPRKTKSGRHQLNLAEELKDVLNEYSNELFDLKEKGLDKAADYFMGKLEQNSPYDANSSNTPHFKDSWTRTDQYKGVRYVGNTKTNTKNIPLSNLIEFGSKGHPFIRKTFDENKDKIIEIIKGEIEHGNTK